MVAVYADTVPPLNDVNRQLLNFIEVYEQDGSGWVFSNFVSLQLSLWHLDPLRASTFFHYPIGYKRVELLLILEGLEMIDLNDLYWQACTQ